LGFAFEAWKERCLSQGLKPEFVAGLMSGINPGPISEAASRRAWLRVEAVQETSHPVISTSIKVMHSELYFEEFEIQI
jgi:hypothetical protein